MNLEPLLCEIRDRCLEATGEEPREVLANYAFNYDFMGEMAHLLVVKMKTTDPFYMKLKPSEFVYRGMLVRCILPTDTTTLIVRT